MIIAFEGIDGAGKATCIDLVSEMLKKSEHSHNKISFPRYRISKTSALIEEILNGALEVESPYFAAAAFAMDRYEAKHLLEDSNQILLCDRYVASNVAFQAGRVPISSRDEMISWILDFEYRKLGLPRADLNIWLDVPTAIAGELIRQKNIRLYTDKTYDAYESDREFQASVASVYRHLTTITDVGRWEVVEACADGNLRPPIEIASDVYGHILRKLDGG